MTSSNAYGKEDEKHQTSCQLKFSHRKRREVSEPPRFVTLASIKMFNEADLLVLENRSTSQARSFKVFDEK